MTDDTTTIEITKAQRAELEERKRHDREPIRDVMARVLADDPEGAELQDFQDTLEETLAAAREATNAAQNAERAAEDLKP